MTRFDKLVKRVLKEEPDLTPEGVRSYLNEVRYDSAFYLADPEAVTAFRHLRQDARVRVVKEYMKRKLPTREATAKADQALFQQVFLYDQAAPGCSFYDVAPFEWVASKQDGKLCWEVSGPDQLRIHLTFPFQSLSEVMGALIRLAVAQKRAFRVEVPERAPRNMFDVVLMPIGDRRAAPYASTPEGALEIVEVPPNTALLFQKGSEPGVGRLSVFDQGQGKCPMYGLTVWSPFYALEFSTPGFEFEHRPQIKI